MIALLRTTEDALKLHVVSDGIPAHSAGESGMVPLNPSMAVNVSVVEPVPPGALTKTVVGLAVTLKAGPLTVSVAEIGLDVGK